MKDTQVICFRGFQKRDDVCLVPLPRLTPHTRLLSHVTVCVLCQMCRGAAQSQDQEDCHAVSFFIDVT